MLFFFPRDVLDVLDLTESVYGDFLPTLGKMCVFYSRLCSQQCLAASVGAIQMNKKDQYKRGENVNPTFLYLKRVLQGSSFYGHVIGTGTLASTLVRIRGGR